MDKFKIALIVLAFLMLGPLVFLAIYSIQTGCLFCLEGDLAGGWQERVLNLVILLPVILALVWGIKAARRR
jgi:membrane protein implicated in regulation of membrane protease activity